VTLASSTFKRPSIDWAQGEGREIKGKWVG